MKSSDIEMIKTEQKQLHEELSLIKECVASLTIENQALKYELEFLKHWVTLNKPINPLGKFRPPILEK